MEHIHHYSLPWKVSKHESRELNGFPKVISLAEGKSKSNVLPPFLADLDFSQNDCQPRHFLAVPTKVKTPSLSMFEIFTWFNFFSFC